VELIVPVVMYFDNGTGETSPPNPLPATPEILVPSTTDGRAKAALVDTPALLRNSARLVATSELGWAGGPRYGRLGRRDRRSSVAAASVVVQQSTFPAVTAPLGWVLSQQSMDTMDRALGLQATRRRSTTTSGRPRSPTTRPSATAIAMTQSVAP
jgi:hypothetical protein